MRLACFLAGIVGLLLPGSAAAQLVPVPPGAYRTAAAYHRRQPQPAGTDAFFPDKRGQVVVLVPRGTQKDRLRLSPDSLWGFVTGKGHTFRLFRGQDYRLEFADTLCVYSASADVGTRHAAGTVAGYGGQRLARPQYYFSRGLRGLVFPLSVPFLRAAYGTSNPAFVAALGTIGLTQSLTDVDRGTGLFRVTQLYREAGGR